MFEFVSARFAALRTKLDVRSATSQTTQRAALVGIGLSCALGLVQAEVTPKQLSSLTMPNGFVIELLTDQVPNARQMALSDGGTLFVGTRSKGSVYAIPSALGNVRQAVSPATPSIPLAVITIANGLTLPSGLVMLGDDLLVGAVDKILRFTDVEKHLIDAAPYQVLTDELPTKRHHGWKYLSIGPDGFLYVPVGAPCNICESTDPRFASILRMNPSSGATTIYAAGIRNTVGLAWHPHTQQLWFSENGRDLLGDDVPPEEINRVTAAGQHFGYPYIHAGTLLDPEFGADADPADYQQPTASFQAHSAPLGIAFYQGEQFPARYRNALFIAEHGSWNRSKKVGYRVSLLRTDDKGLVGTPPTSVEPFISGWLQGEESWGRPNDVLLAADGSLLISDDQAGAIYRVRYQPTR
jgi:glucose/arabinose dehydrogenase